MLAHLVERFHGMEEVRSSNLLHSTTKLPARVIFCVIMASVGGLQIKSLEVEALTQGEKFLRKIQEDYPELKERTKVAYRKLRHVALQKYEPRMGYGKFGMIDVVALLEALKDEETGEILLPEVAATRPGKKLIDHPKLPGDMIITDSDHGFMLLQLTGIMEDFYGPYVPVIFKFQPQWHQIDKDLKDHEVDENVIGDWTDNDHSKRELKARMEWKLHLDWVKGFPQAVAEHKLNRFTLFQARKIEGYALDKAIFVLAQGILKHHFGIVGNYDEKPGLYEPTPDDLGWRELTGSDRVVDNLYAHFLHNTRGLSAFRTFLIFMIEEMYAREFDGYIPETVKALY